MSSSVGNRLASLFLALALLLSSPLQLFLSTSSSAYPSSLAAAHLQIGYPLWRGNNLIANGTIHEGVLGIDEQDGDITFPYGMQWMYPCGGMRTTTNRTNWPINGGAVAFQPGWFANHPTAYIYINMGFGNEPLNMSHPLIPHFQLVGPSAEPYEGTFCMPQLPLPANITAKVGDNATIQVIETALHGAALYACADITFAEPEDVPEVNSTNCYNSTGLGHNLIFASSSLSAATTAIHVPAAVLVVVPMLLSAALTWLS